MSISKGDSNLKLIHDKVKEAITNDTENSCLMSNEKYEYYNEVSYTHSFSNDNFDDHSTLDYDNNVVDNHMPYDELLDAFDELFVEYKKIASKNSYLKKHVVSPIIELNFF